jgi:hypothetical protein
MIIYINNAMNPERSHRLDIGRALRLGTGIVAVTVGGCIFTGSIGRMGEQSKNCTTESSECASPSDALPMAAGGFAVAFAGAFMLAAGPMVKSGDAPASEPREPNA